MRVCRLESGHFALQVKECGRGLQPPGSAQTSVCREQYARFNHMWLDDPWLLPVHTNQRIEVANSNVKGYGEHFVTIFEQPNLAKVWLEA